jgi:hypothetical protein
MASDVSGVAFRSVAAGLARSIAWTITDEVDEGRMKPSVTSQTSTLPPVGVVDAPPQDGVHEDHGLDGEGIAESSERANRPFWLVRHLR